MILRFTIPGEPQAKERPKVYAMKGGKGVRGVTPPRTRAYAERGALCARAAVAREGWTYGDGEAYRVCVAVYRTHYGLGGDIDNVAKAALDAMNGIVFADDRYVRALYVSLEQDAENPRLEIEVEKMASAPVKRRRKAAA